jgi:hypothetical protein
MPIWEHRQDRVSLLLGELGLMLHRDYQRGAAISPLAPQYFTLPSGKHLYPLAGRIQFVNKFSIINRLYAMLPTLLRIYRID